MRRGSSHCTFYVCTAANCIVGLAGSTSLDRTSLFSKASSHRIPHGQPTRGNDRQEDDEHVVVVDAHRISIDDKRAVAAAHLDKPILLLQPTEKQPQENAQDRSKETDQTPLEKEDATDLLVGSSKIAQGDDIVFLVDNQHRQRADDVETSHDQDESEEDIAEIRQKYIDTYGGVKNASKPIVKSGKINFETIDTGTSNNQTNQLTESKEYQTKVISLMFGIPPQMLIRSSCLLYFRLYS